MSTTARAVRVPAQPSVLVSVVIPTCRRPDLLQRCLQALLQQDFDPARYEIVVADDAASPETRRLVEAIVPPGGPYIRYVAVTGRHGPAAARNQGWQDARGRIVAFTDDDCVPEPDWLREGVAAFGPQVLGACGAITMPIPERPTDYEKDAAGLARAEFATANCFYRRDTLRAAGGFDERFTAAWREDSDLHFTVLERGAREGKQLVRVPAAVVLHPVRPATWGISLRQQRKAMFNALLYRKHPALYRQKVQPSPPWGYYASVASLLILLVGFLGGWAAIAVAAAGLWLGLTLEFTWRRLRGTSRAPSHIAEMLVTSALIPPLSVYWRLRGAMEFRVFFI